MDNQAENTNITKTPHFISFELMGYRCELNLSQMIKTVAEGAENIPLEECLKVFELPEELKQ